MSDTPSASSTNSPLGAGTGEGAASSASREARNFANTTGQRASQAASAAVDKASAALSTGMDTAQARMKDFQQWAGVQNETARERIRESPMTAVAVTFGAGVLLGLLLNRR
jgi:ElaB/YqjD/DUF883 family membrane-anchored ribosome-binding protein